ncbi:MAG TPA: acyl carrier protein [Phycisphaerae bacterium]|nr:acyl carrier protein [Phycisphaerae bacterium]
MTRDEIKDKVVRAITDVLSLDSQEEEILRDENYSGGLTKWTSATHAEIIVAVEDAFDIEIDEMRIPGLNNVARIIEYIQQTV